MKRFIRVYGSGSVRHPAKYLIFNPEAESRSAFECLEHLLALSCRGLTLSASDLTLYVCKSFAMLELCDSMIHKTEFHKRDAAENVLKFNDLLLSFLCESHSQAIKLINRVTCSVYFNNAKKQVNIIKFDENWLNNLYKGKKAVKNIIKLKNVRTVFYCSNLNFNCCSRKMLHECWRVSITAFALKV